MIDLLAIAAHPDDVELACAGTMLMAKRDGKRTGIVDLTEGELSTRGTVASRRGETEAASKILGLDYRANLGMPDGNIELSQENLHKLIVQIRKLRPTIILAPSKYERHPDHESAAELAHRAWFYGGLAKIETVDENGEPQAPHRALMMLHFMQSYTFEPRIIMDVTPVFEERMRAIEAYGSQFIQPKSHGAHFTSEIAGDKTQPETYLTQASFFDWNRARASFYGMMIGTQYAEPFWAQEALGTKDLFSLVTKKVA